MYEVYTKENCPFCYRAKALLREKGLQYKEIILGRDMNVEEFKQEFPGVRQVPFIIQHVPVGGYDDLVNHLTEKETEPAGSEGDNLATEERDVPSPLQEVERRGEDTSSHVEGGCPA